VVLPCDVVPLSGTLEELVWVGTQGNKVTIIDGLSHLTRLRVLCLRSNLLRSCAGLSSVIGTLEELELYDNQLRELEELEGARGLRLLDVSYNKLRSLQGLRGAAPLLEVLYAASNRLTEPIGDTLTACAHSLRRLDLGSNALPSMAGVEVLVNLEELWLGKNKITQVEGLAGLQKLRILDVQSNRLTCISGLCGGGGFVEGEGQGEAAAAAPWTLPALEELYLGHQGLPSLDGLPALPSLKVLDVSGNGAIAALDPGLAALCPALTDLWAGYTGIASYEAAALGALGELKHLAVLYLEHTPVAKEWDYRTRVVRALPTLQQLDANEIKPMKRGVGTSSGGGGGGSGGGGGTSSSASSGSGKR
jgi:protein phosphatase 1 regulatory subunit 7